MTLHILVMYCVHRLADRHKYVSDSYVAVVWTGSSVS